MLWFSLGCSPAVDESAVAPEVPVNAPDAQPVPDTIALRHILFGATQESELEVAHARAAAVQARLAHEDFAAVARLESDGPTGRRGGWLGASTRDAWTPAFSDAAWRLQVGEVSDPVVTEYGVHLIKREALIEVHLKHIVVQHRDALMLDEGALAASRTPEDARVRADEVLVALNDGGDFKDLAREYSDGPFGPRGGDLGLFLLGELGPEIDAAVAPLQPGERTDVVETLFGFHILERYE